MSWSKCPAKKTRWRHGAYKIIRKSIRFTHLSPMRMVHDKNLLFLSHYKKSKIFEYQYSNIQSCLSEMYVAKY